MRIANPLKACAIAFSRFSAIPMPIFRWEEKEMEISLIFFPLVGAVIGLAEIFIDCLARRAGIPQTAEMFLLALAPIVISGGIHLDGYMDVKDAMSSYRSREEKLQILKDPHIGAFAVIHLAKIGLIYLASLSVLISAAGRDLASMAVLAGTFSAARALSAVGILTMKNAKDEGTLYESAREAKSTRAVQLAAAILWLAVSLGIGIVSWPVGGLAVTAAAGAAFGFYGWMSHREFGGITGDLAGYFVVVSEVAMAAAAAVCGVIVC